MDKKTDKKTILEHELVPRHEILEKEESEAILAEYGISAEQLPKIMEDDPISETISAKKGDVLKITRVSPTAGESIYYRLVV